MTLVQNQRPEVWISKKLGGEQKRDFLAYLPQKTFEWWPPKDGGGGSTITLLFSVTAHEITWLPELETCRAEPDFKEHLLHLYLTREEVKSRWWCGSSLINKQLSKDRSQVSDSHYPIWIFSSNDSFSIRFSWNHVPTPLPHSLLSLPRLCFQLHLVLSFIMYLSLCTLINCLHAYPPIRL